MTLQRTVLSAIAGVLLAAAPVAQSLAQKAAGAEEIQEVVVTAQKRSENLQKVSQSIQVKQGEDLRQTGKGRLDEIMQGTVGIQAQDNRLGLTFFVRGVDSSAGNPGVSIPSPVAVLVDGVTESRTEVVRGNTLDVSQVEIMRGPQSTVLGANALSGAVSLVSNNPVLDKYEAMGSVDKGSYSKSAFQGVLNLPLGATTALRVGYASEKRDGYISSGAGNSDLSTLRVKFRWQVRENLNTVLTVNRQEVGGNGTNQNQLLAYGYWHPIVQGANGTDTGPTGINLTSTGCNSNNPGISTFGCPTNFYAITPGQPDGTQPSFRQRPDAWNDGYPANSFPNSPYLQTTVTKVSEQIDWNTSLGTLTVLPSFEHATLANIETPMGSSYMGSFETQDTTTADVHFNSVAGKRTVWTAGAYYSYDKTSNALTAFANYPGGGPGPPAPAWCTNATVTCWAWQNQPLQTRSNYSLYFNGNFKMTDAFRLVGGARYSSDKAEQSQLQQVGGTAAGPDYSIYAKSCPPPFIDPTCVAYPTTDPLAQASYGSAKWNHVTYRGGVEFDVRPQTMLYATYSTGYTPGRFSVAQPGGPPAEGATPPSTLKQIALGWKSQLFANRLQFNGEIFSSTYFNRPIQGTINAYYGGASSVNCFYNGFPPPPLAIGSNGAGGYCALGGQDAAFDPELKSSGVDIDGVWLLSADDRLGFTFEYLKSEYQAMPIFNPTAGVDYSPSGILANAGGLACAPGQTTNCLTTEIANSLSQSFTASLAGFVGATPQNSPATSATVDYSHVFHLRGGSELVPRIAGTYKSKYWSFGGAPGANVSTIISAGSDPSSPWYIAWQQAYVSWDAYLAWRSASGKFDVNAYAKNLTNEVIMQNYTYPFVALGAPRTVGVIINAHL